MTTPEQAIAARLKQLWDQVARAEDEAIGDHLSMGTFSHLLNPLLHENAKLTLERDSARDQFDRHVIWAEQEHARLTEPHGPTIQEAQAQMATLADHYGHGWLAGRETLERRLAEAEQQRDTAHAALDDVKATLASWLEHAESGPSESPAAWSVTASQLKRLLYYTKHHWDCARLGPTWEYPRREYPDNACTCGLDAALAASAPQKEGDGR